MARIVGLAGSLRKGSYNAALLRAAAALAPAGTTVDIATIAGIPLYDGDVETAGMPAAVSALKDRIATSDGLMLVTPEYNHSIPGVFKNAIDWLSRPSADSKRVFGGKPVVIMGATTGAGGTRLSQAAWLPVLRALDLRPWYSQSMFLTQAATAFDANGGIADDKTRAILAKLVTGFSAYVEESRPKRESAAP